MHWTKSAFYVVEFRDVAPVSQYRKQRRIPEDMEELMRTGPQRLPSKATLTVRLRSINGEVRLANKRVPSATTQIRRFLTVAPAAIKEATRHEAEPLIKPASATSTAMRNIHVVRKTIPREARANSHQDC